MPAFQLRSLPLPILMLVSAASYHVAMAAPVASPWLVMLSMAALCAMTGARTARRAFYAGIGTGFLIFVPQLWFFFGIFKFMAVALWLCLAVWTGIFSGTLHVARRKGGAALGLLVAPVLWMGLEYFRSEVWLLRFSWLTPGYALPAERMGWLFQSLGVYGSGALLVLAGAVFAFTALSLKGTRRWCGIAAGVILPPLLLPGQWEVTSGGSLRVTGIQFEQGFEGNLPSALNQTVMEKKTAPAVTGQDQEQGKTEPQDDYFSFEDRVLARLNEALAQYPDTQLFVLPEYIFHVTVPKDFTDWCRAHQRYLIAGGRDYAPGLFNSRKLRAYYNTAWVIGPEGTVVHRQAKSMPIQFFEDGMPAAVQRVWESPWGRLGICICYDQNYAMVTDALAAQDMQALLIPTMDVIRWGEYQHHLSARLATTRAAEYGVPVVRLASSGVSLMTDGRGQVLAQGGVPGQGEIVSAIIPLSAHARHPVDRLAAKASCALSGLLVCMAISVSFVDERRRRRSL